MLTYRQIITPFENYFVADEGCPELHVEARKGNLFLGTVLDSFEDKFGKRTKSEVIDYYKERLRQLIEQGYYFDLPPIKQRIIDYNMNLLDDTLECKSVVLVSLFEEFYKELEKSIEAGRVRVDKEYNSIDRYDLERVFKVVAKKSKLVTSDFLPAVFYC